MSEIADKIYQYLCELFPNFNIIKEHYVNTRLCNVFQEKDRFVKLFFDFYVKELGILIEVQGRQHIDYIDHFHGSKEKFLQQKYRDNLKVAYVQANESLSLVRFYYNEKITKKLILKKLNKVFNEKESVV